MLCRITTDWPPSVNRYWRNNRGRTHIAKHGIDYREHVREEVFAECLERQLTGRLRVLIELYPPDRRKRDIDNTAKAILDSLQKSGLFVDDEQIDDLRIVRRELLPPGRAVITVEEVA